MHILVGNVFKNMSELIWLWIFRESAESVCSKAILKLDRKSYLAERLGTSLLPTEPERHI